MVINKSMDNMLNFSILMNCWSDGFFFKLVVFDMEDILLLFGECIVVGIGFFCFVSFNWLLGILNVVVVGSLWLGFGDLGVVDFIG